MDLMKRQTIIMGLMMVLISAVTANADIYRWKDANGVMNFSNQPPPAGTTVIEKIEELPFDAEADRQRIEEERRLRLERQKLEVEERKADIAGREREAQFKLEEANRRMQQAEQQQQQALSKERNDDNCGDAFLRYGDCGSGYGYGYYVNGGRTGPYNPYYRENNSLYYKDPPKPRPRPPLRPGKPQPKDDLNVKGTGGPSAPFAPK